MNLRVNECYESVRTEWTGVAVNESIVSNDTIRIADVVNGHKTIPAVKFSSEVTMTCSAVIINTLLVVMNNTLRPKINDDDSGFT